LAYSDIMKYNNIDTKFGGIVMDRKLETIFDLVTDNLAPIDKDTPHVVGIPYSNQVDSAAKAQQVLTMRRIAAWLRCNSKIYQLEWDHSLARELKMLADDLEHLATTKENLDAHK